MHTQKKKRIGYYIVRFYTFIPMVSWWRNNLVKTSLSLLGLFSAEVMKIILMISSRELAAVLEDFLLVILLQKSSLFAFYRSNLIFINISNREVWQLGTAQTHCFLFFVYFSHVNIINTMTAV